MALRGKKPSALADGKRLKAMFFGPAGVGKTTAAIQFPRPYLIDTERGAENEQYVKLLEARGGAVFQTSDFEDMVKELTSLLSERHEYQTLIIDPITVLYSELLERAAKKVGTDFGRHYAEADRRMRHLLNLMLRLDMNVIVTAHAKNMYAGTMEVVGQTFDAYKKLDYLFDLVFELQRRGKERVGVVKKTRIEAFVEGDVFPFTYDAVADRYGRATLERDATPETLATKEQRAELVHLIDLLKLDTETTDKWLTKAGAETWEEMPSVAAGKCIEWMKAKIAGKEG